jgi:hypothetical protein
MPLNVAADGLAALPAVTALLPPVAENGVDQPTGELFAEIRAFYGRGDVPPVFRFLARDPAYAADVWAATRRASVTTSSRGASRRPLAFAVSLTSRSEWGHGVSPGGDEAVGGRGCRRDGGDRRHADVLELHQDRPTRSSSSPTWAISPRGRLAPRREGLRARRAVARQGNCARGSRVRQGDVLEHVQGRRNRSPGRARVP